MILLNHSDRRYIAEIILTNNYLLIINEEKETEAYYLSRVQPCGNPVSKRYRHILREMKKGVQDGDK